MSKKTVMVIGPKMPPVTGERLCVQRLLQTLGALGCAHVHVPNNRCEFPHRASVVWVFFGASRVGFIRDLVRSFAHIALRRRLIINIHNGSWRRFLRLPALARRPFMRCRFVVLSDDLVVQLLEHGYNATRLDNYVDDPVAARPGPARGRKRLIWLSSVTEEKGFEVALNTFEHLYADDPEWVFDVFGDGPAADLARGRPNVTLRGAVTQEQLRDVFDDGGILLLPSMYANENQPLVVLEAFAAGVPVVVSNVGALPEMVAAIRSSGGISIPTNDAPDYADAVRSVFSEYDSHSKGARTLFETRYAKGVFSRRVEHLIENIAQQ